jgi:demethylmenaquinone methyltransferase/2-methoxy-6-polyprenyl-1,4-benzoquinol methylase
MADHPSRVAGHQGTPESGKGQPPPRLPLDSRAIRPESPAVPDAVYVRDAFARIADRYVLTNHVLSCGADVWWRKVVASRIRRWHPARALDVASGTGDLALEIQRQCPACEVIATDFCEEMLAHAARRGVAHTRVADALNLPFPTGGFDVVTVAFGLRNMADYPAALREMGRVLKPGGHLLILDFSLPDGLLRRPYRFYLHHLLPRLAGWLTGQRDAYEYLGGSIESFPSGTAMTGLLESSGLIDTHATPLTGGVVSIYQGTRPSTDPLPQ